LNASSLLVKRRKKEKKAFGSYAGTPRKAKRPDEKEGKRKPEGSETCPEITPSRVQKKNELKERKNFCIRSQQKYRKRT